MSEKEQFKGHSIAQMGKKDVYSMLWIRSYVLMIFSSLFELSRIIYGNILTE